MASSGPATIQTEPGAKPLGFTEPLPFFRPTLPQLEAVEALYGEVYKSGLVTNGALVERLEQAVAERLGVNHCVAVSSCTSGLMLAMKALDLSGEVILPSFTFFATGQAVLWNGLTPVLADCTSDRWTIDPEDVARRITKNTAAILGVHLYGNPCQIERLQSVATESGVKLLFDAAHAFGSSCAGMRIGRFGDAEVFSLSPTKSLIAGEGGMITTNDRVLARRLRSGRNYGNAGSYDPELLGLSARMTEFNAAMAIAGLDLVNRKVARHNEIAELYASLLEGVPGLRFQVVRQQDRSTYKDYSVHVTASTFGCTSVELAAGLFARNIETRRYFCPPLHGQKIFLDAQQEGSLPLPVTDLISTGIVCLPIYESLGDHDVAAIATAVQEIGKAAAAER